MPSISYAQFVRQFQSHYILLIWINSIVNKLLTHSFATIPQQFATASSISRLCADTQYTTGWSPKINSCALFTYYAIIVLHGYFVLLLALHSPIVKIHCFGNLPFLFRYGCVCVTSFQPAVCSAEFVSNKQIRTKNTAGILDIGFVGIIRDACQNTRNTISSANRNIHFIFLQSLSIE